MLFLGVAGGKVSRDAGPVKGGSTHIAFVDDPTGYKWELIQRTGPIPEPIAQVRCRARVRQAGTPHGNKGGFRCCPKVLECQPSAPRRLLGSPYVAWKQYRQYVKHDA